MKKKFALVLFVTFFFQYQNNSLAQSTRDSLLYVLNNYNQEDTIKINILIETANLHWYSEDHIRKYYNEIYTLSQKLNYKKGVFLGLYAKFILSPPDSAERILYKMKGIVYDDFSRSITDAIDLQIFVEKGEYDSAFKFYEQFSKRYNNTRIGYSFCLANRLISSAYLGIGDTIKAREYLYLAESTINNFNYFIQKEGMRYMIALDWLNRFDDFEEYDRNFKLVLQSLRKMKDNEAELNILIWGGTKANMYKNYSKVLEYNYRILELCRDTIDKKMIAFAYHNLQESFRQIKDYSKAIKYGLESMKLYKELNDTGFYIGLHNILGLLYLEVDSLEKADWYFSRALDLGRKENFDYDIARSYMGKALVSEKRKDFLSAQTLYLQSLPHVYKTFPFFRPEFYSHLSNCYLILKNYEKAKLYADSVFSYLGENEYSETTKKAANVLQKIYVIKGDYKKAYHYFNLYHLIGEKINTNEAKQLDIIHEYQKKVENEKKEQEQMKIAHMNKDKLNKQILDHQKSLRNVFFGAFVIIFMLSILIFRNYRQKQKANTLLKEQKAEIEEINEELQIQKEEIEVHNKSMTDSIVYAQRIQSALLPPLTYVDELLHENFIFNKPRDIVSGDFYWVKQVNQYIVLCVADCTGHGVPGAFMSMLGISFLTEIVQRREITQANQILNELRRQVKYSLRQRGQSDESRDGMDIALCVIDTKSNLMQYAGAYNPLYLIKDMNGKAELIEYKADRMPVGFFHGKDKSFTNHEIRLEIGDTFYIFSDGFIDQYGGDKEEKFKRKNFKELLLRIHERSLTEQKELLNKALQKWMKGSDQTDDILIMGVRI